MQPKNTFLPSWAIVYGPIKAKADSFFQLAVYSLDTFYTLTHLLKRESTVFCLKVMGAFVGTRKQTSRQQINTGLLNISISVYANIKEMI